MTSRRPPEIRGLDPAPRRPAEPIGDEDEDTAPGLAEGSEVHDQEALAREAAIDDMLAAYLRDQDGADPGPRARLVLYVLSGSPSCAMARKNLERALRYYEARDVMLVIRDLAHGPKTEEEQAIMSVPTLMMKHPRVAFISGELSGGKGTLDEFLRSAGVRRRAPR